MSLNKAMLIGNLGADPELKYTPNQLAVTQLNVATSDRTKGADGNWTDRTEWHRVVVFGKTAENCCQYLKKGRSVFVEGKIQTRKWQDKEGRDHYSTEIIAHTVNFLGSKDASAASAQKTPPNKYKLATTITSSVFFTLFFITRHEPPH